MTDAPIEAGSSPPRILIASMTAMGSMTATGQLISRIFGLLPSVDVVSLHAGHASDDSAAMQIAFRVDGIRKILRQVRAFAPDVIYLRPTLKPLAFHVFVTYLLLALDVKLIVHIMDDEVMDRSNGSRLTRYLFAGYLFWVLRRADKVFTISSAMSEEYLRRYGVASVALANIPRSKYSVEVASTRLSKAPRIGYFGSLNARMNRECVSRVSRALETLHADKFDVELDVYTRDLYVEWGRRVLESGCVKVHPYVDDEDFAATLAAYDVLLIAYNFDETSIDYCRFSIANKLADYIEAGRAILTIGPKQVASVAICSEYGIGSVIAKGYDSLEEDLRRYLESLDDISLDIPRYRESYLRAMQCDTAKEQWRSAMLP